MPITETFDEACSALADFLRRQGQSSELLWVCRDDVSGRRRRLFVHPSPPASNRELYQRHFEFGVRQARGVRLDVLCFAAGRACCYVWVPEDNVASSQAMLTDGLRMGFAVESHESGSGFHAQQCSSSAEFYLRRIWCRFRGESPLIQELPLRADIQSNDNTRNA